MLDAVGTTTFGRCRRLLRPGGAFLSPDAGPLWQSLLLAVVAPLFGGRKVLLPTRQRSQATVRRIRELLEAGAFRPVVDRRYSLAEIVDAHRYADAGQTVGGVVISVDRSS